jgi:hypothetical protein
LRALRQTGVVTPAPAIARATPSAMADVFATAVAPGGLLTSPEDKRLYRRLELPNGLVAILVHDPHMAAHGPAVSPGCLRRLLANP